MRNAIKELNNKQAEVDLIRSQLEELMRSRLDLFCKAMHELEMNDPDVKIWSQHRYPYSLTDDSWSSFKFKLKYTACEADRIGIDWSEEEYRGGSSNSRNHEFSVHNALFEDNYKSYIRLRTIKFKEEIDARIELKREADLKAKNLKIDRMKKEIEKLENI